MAVKPAAAVEVYDNGTYFNGHVDVSCALGTIDVAYSGYFNGCSEEGISPERVRTTSAGEGSATLERPTKRHRKIPNRYDDVAFQKLKHLPSLSQALGTSDTKVTTKKSDQEKTSEKQEEEEEEWHKDHPYVGRRILRKDTDEDGDEWEAYGCITGWLSSERNGGAPALWHAVHDDGDEEDLTEEEARAALDALDIDDRKDMNAGIVNPLPPPPSSSSPSSTAVAGNAENEAIDASRPIRIGDVVGKYFPGFGWYSGTVTGRRLLRLDGNGYTWTSTDILSNDDETNGIGEEGGRREKNTLLTTEDDGGHEQKIRCFYAVTYNDGDAEEYEREQVLEMRATLGLPPPLLKLRRLHRDELMQFVEVEMDSLARIGWRVIGNDERGDDNGAAEGETGRELAPKAVDEGVTSITGSDRGEYYGMNGRESTSTGDGPSPEFRTPTTVECTLWNCRRKGTASWRRYEAYKTKRTLRGYFGAGATIDDLIFDFSKGHLRLQDAGLRRRLSALLLRHRREEQLSLKRNQLLSSERDGCARRGPSEQASLGSWVPIKPEGIEVDESDSLALPGGRSECGTTKSRDGAVVTKAAEAKAPNGGGGGASYDDGDDGDDEGFYEDEFCFQSDACQHMPPLNISNATGAATGRKLRPLRANAEEWETEQFLKRRSDLHWARLERKYLGLVLHDKDVEAGYDEVRLIVRVEYSVTITPPQWVVVTRLLQASDVHEQEDSDVSPNDQEPWCLSQQSKASDASDANDLEADSEADDDEAVPYLINEELHRMILLCRDANSRTRRIICLRGSHELHTDAAPDHLAFEADPISATDEPEVAGQDASEGTAMAKEKTYV